MNFIDMVKQSKAVRVTESLVSVNQTVKLPSYAGESKSGKGPRYVTWGDKDSNAVLDSVQSQANRIEAIFTEYKDLVPATQVVYPDCTIPLVEVPHRGADPAISYYFRKELDALTKAPGALAKLNPTAFLFGICDIRNGRNIRLTRAIASDVTIRNGVMRPSASSLSTPLSNETRGKYAEQCSHYKLDLAEIGLEQIPAWSERGTIDASTATITRTVVFSVEVFDRYKNDRALYDYLLGLAVVAVLAPTTSVLRSGTTLVRQSRKVQLFEDLKPAENVPEDGLFDEVLTFARAAAKKFGVGEAKTLTVDIDTIIKEAKCGDETKKTTAARKNSKAAEAGAASASV